MEKKDAEKPFTTNAIYPKWLLNSLNDISDSREWNGFVGDLQDTIEHQLLESHIQHFADLKDSEKQLFVDNAVLALQQSPAYQVASRELSNTLDEHINDTVGREMRLGRNPYLTRTELLLSSVQEAIVGIVDRWPELRGKMVRFLNQPLGSNMRHHVWRVFLRDHKINAQYREVLANNPRTAISKQDKEITQRVENFLNTEQLLSDMRGSVGCFYGIKAVISYHQAMKKSGGRVLDTEIFLMTPFLMVIVDKISRKEPPTVAVMEILVQQYFAFLRSRPAYMRPEEPSSVAADEAMEEQDPVVDELRRFAQQVMSFVSKINGRVAQAYMDAFAPSPVDIVATETKLFESLGDAMISLIRPVIRPLFYGFLNRDCLLFIWDQYIIGLDTPGFHDILLPALMAAFLVLVGRGLVGDENRSPQIPKFESVMRKEGFRLKAADFQYIINQHFYSDLFHRITREKITPSLDPTLKPFDTTGKATEDKGLHWEAWYKDFTQPQRTKPTQRDHFRVLREEEKQRLRELEQHQLDEAHRRQALELALRVAEDSRTAEVKAEKERAMRERRSLMEQLANERQLRHLAEKTGQEEIIRLQEELEFAKAGVLSDYNDYNDRSYQHTPTKPSAKRPESEGSMYVLPNPPGSPTSNAEPLPRTINDTGKKRGNWEYQDDPDGISGEQRCKTALEDYLRMFMGAVRKINNSVPPDSAKLDEATRDMQLIYEEDRINAEVELFGHELKAGELEAMDEGNDNYYANKIYEEIDRKANQRRRNMVNAANNSIAKTSGPV